MHLGDEKGWAEVVGAPAWWDYEDAATGYVEGFSDHQDQEAFMRNAPTVHVRKKGEGGDGRRFVVFVELSYDYTALEAE